MYNPESRRAGLVQRSVSKTYVDINSQTGQSRDQRQLDGLQLRARRPPPAAPPDEPAEADQYVDPGPPKFEERPRKRRRRDPLYNETNGYILMGLIVICVVVFSFSINRHEMQQLREVHGHDSRKPVTKDIWWHNALVYQIYPRSFQDSNGDGVGDLNGILSRMPHLLGLSVNVVMLNSVMKSPPGDTDRGVSDFMVVDSQLGTQEDFDNLLKELHDRGIHVIVEFIINHTSDKHRWFQESRKGGTDNKYADYYIWSPGRELENGTKIQPSNWVSRHGGSMWSWDDVRGEYYLHQYGSSMPDLNHRNSKVRKEFIEIFESWLGRGVDGIYLEGVQALYEVEDLLLDEPLSEAPDIPETDWRYLDHVYTDDQPEVHEFLATWREQLDAYMHRTKRKVFLGVEVMDDRMMDVLYYYQTGADAPLSLILSDLAADCDAYTIHELVDTWLLEVPEGRTSFWGASNHEVGRLAARKGAAYKGVLAMLQLLLPGGAVIYYGDEIGMEHHQTAPSDVIVHEHFSHQVHNGSRTPMQWSAEKNAGFSTAEQTWLPVYENYETVNVEVQLPNIEEGHTRTTLQLYRRLVRLRSEPAFSYGRIEFVTTTKEIFSFTRFVKDEHSYFVVMNFGKEESTEDYFHAVGVDRGQVICHVTGASSRETLGEDDFVNLINLTLAPGEGMVLRLFAIVPV